MNRSKKNPHDFIAVFTSLFDSLKQEWVEFSELETKFGVEFASNELSAWN